MNYSPLKHTNNISDDKKLIDDFLAGDDPAFEYLVKKYLKSTYNFLFLITGDKSIIDDLTQITFIKAWKNIHRFDRNKNFKTWLFAIAKNTAYDYFKKKRTMPFSQFSDEQGNNKLEEISEDKILPLEILERQDLAEELEKKLEEISPPYKTILVMHFKDDLSLPEISEILGKPINTVKSQYYRALKNLKKVFEEV